ncbi:MAG: response regulator [Bdellovibrionaceae bacterium]|jgi:signal transduction histidine kinase/AmiR/NasT family two-component response regulator|nr:response regulator [Pseudobdellovibrionaceae bacterium]
MAEFTDQPFLIRTTKAGGFVRSNASFSDKVGIAPEELAKKSFIDWIAPEDQFLFNDLLEGKIESCTVRHLTKGEDTLELNVRISKKHDDCIVLARFIKKHNRPKYFDDFSREANVKSTLHEIAHIVEEQNPGYKCSILLVEDGHFVKGAGPSLPDAYNNAIDGFAIGPTVGSCGTAIYWNVPVIVCDIQNDPLWVPFAELAKQAGVNSCWSHPFTSKSGNVLGALALYSPKSQTPTFEQLGQLKAITAMTGLAVERGRAEEALQKKHNEALELEDQLRQAAKMEALGVLAGGVAHDFNNVLATILGNVELSLIMLDKIPDNAEKLKIELRLKNVITASHRAGAFSNQMLSYAGRGAVATKKTEIGKLISELDSLVLAALSKKTTLDFELEEKPIFVNGDENQLLQVIMNLVTNAAQAVKNKEGRIVVSSKIEDFNTDTLKKLSPEDDLPAGTYACLTVSDNGTGISESIKDRIFDPFYTTKVTGRGLGLSAVKGIIKMHGGLISLESELNKGTTFTVLLPILENESNSNVINIVDTSDLQNKTNINKRILLADDEEDLLLVLSDSLDYYGYEVVSAMDGQEAVDLFKKSPDSFDCILMDLSMPRLSGQEAAIEINKLNPNVPIVIMSGYNENEFSENFDLSILTKSLQKPIGIKELIEALDSTLSNRDPVKKLLKKAS